MDFIDLFSGCGGFSTGLEMAGHRCLLGVDFDRYAVESFRKNHPHALGHHGDITQLSAKDLDHLLQGQKIDMVVGGPPCQGFSTVGKGVVQDDRNKLFKHFVRVVKLLSPKVVLFENVTGLLAQKNQAVLKSIFREFEKLGYCMEARVLSAQDFGVPSFRRRTILMGVKGGVPLYPAPSFGPQTKQALRTVSDAFKGIRASTPNHSLQSAQILKPQDQKIIKYIPEGKGIRYQQDEKEFLPKNLHLDVNWETLREGRFRQTKYQRLHRNLPSPTIMTSRTNYYHPTEPRFLTAREAAACQSFPHEFEFMGPQSAVFRQIGNAVPPFLAKAIGEILYELKFDGKVAASKKKKLDLGRTAFHYR